MPTLIIRRFPLPSVSIYLILSASLLFLAVMWANNTLVEEQELLENKKAPAKSDSLDVEAESNIKKKPKEAVVEVWSYPKSPDGSPSESSLTFSVKRDARNSQDGSFIGTEIAKSVAQGNHTFAYGILRLMLDEPLCLMLVVNATYCVLIIVMFVIQKIVFGRLRPIERQHMKDKFWNFVFYKFIFIFGVMNVQSLNEVLIWVSWFTAIACLLLLTKLSKDRFEFLSFSPNTPMLYHWKVVSLLVFVLFFCVLLGISCILRSFPFSSFSEDYYDIHSTTFMLAEAVIIAVKAVHVLLRYSIHLYDIRHVELWERKATLVYHVDLVMELLSLVVNFVHHLHMLFSGNIWLSMASLVICMQLRFIFTEIQKRYLRHKNYRRVVANMDAQFPEATAEELAQHEDRCAICWDQMESARKLPCGHLFHSPCLRSWLEQDTTCPTCRKQLGIRQSDPDQNVNNNPANQNDPAGNPGPNPAAAVLNPAAGPGVAVPPHRNHFWHFDGSRFASWLPSFSVEVTHSPRGQREISNSQLDSMVRDVQEIFPQIPARVIANDLRTTGSVEATTNNILEGSIAVPPDQMVPAHPDDRQNDFQIPVTSRSEPIMGSTVVRRRNVSSLSDPILNRGHRSDLHREMLLPARVADSVSLSSATDETNSTTTASVGSSRNSTVTPQLDPPVSHSPTYGHFSKAPEERENILQKRRDVMVRQARLKYLTRTAQQSKSKIKDGEKPSSELARLRSTGHDTDDVRTSAAFEDALALRRRYMNFDQTGNGDTAAPTGDESNAPSNEGS